jgi:hypothetical protein
VKREKAVNKIKRDAKKAEEEKMHLKLKTRTKTAPMSAATSQLPKIPKKAPKVFKKMPEALQRILRGSKERPPKKSHKRKAAASNANCIRPIEQVILG